MSAMKRPIREKVWFHKMDAMVENFVRKCRGCYLVSHPENPLPMKRRKLPSQPWKYLTIDFLGPLPDGKHIFVIVDYFSRFLEVRIKPSISTKAAIKLLKEAFARFGVPIIIKKKKNYQ